MTYDFRFVSKELRTLIEPATLVSHRFDSPMEVRVFSNAYIAPYVGWEESIGCLLDETGEVIKDSECLEWKEDSQYYDVEQSTKECKDVVYLGFLLTVFGHSYTDNLRKLWFVKSSLFKSLVASGAEIVYTTSWNYTLPDYVFEIFRLAGFDLSQAHHITGLTQYNRVFLPDNCFKAGESGRIYSKEYESLINCLKLNIPYKDNKNLSHEKVYFSRSKYNKGLKREYGEQSIDRLFSSLGYTIVYPEECSFIDQVNIVRNCRCFAATEGSVAHLSLFCKPGTSVIFLNKANYMNFHQVMINEFADLDVTYIEAHHSSRVDPKHPWWGPFYLYITNFLEQYVEHKIIHLPYWIKPSYWEYTRNSLYRIYNRGRKILLTISQNH